MKIDWNRIFTKEYWKEITFIAKTIEWAKNTSFIGLRGVPVYDVIKFLYLEAQDDSITTRANSMAFSFFIALFPAIIFLFTLVPLLPTAANYALDIRESVQGILPPPSEDYLFGIVEDIVSKQRSGLLSFGLVLAIFFASNGMSTMISGFEKSAHTQTFRRRHFFAKRSVAILLTVILAVIFLISSLLIVLGHMVSNLMVELLDLTDFAAIAFSALRWVIIIMLIYSSFSVIYRYAPAVNERFKFFSAGSSVATFLTIAVSLGFSYFVTNFGKYNELYGSIGALIITLLWFNINCFILLVGFELNASIAVNRDNLKSQGFFPLSKSKKKVKKPKKKKV